MVTVNVVVLAGTISADPVQRRMPSGDEVTELRVSVPETGRRLLPLPVAAWHATVGARALESLAKGDHVLVQLSRLTQGTIRTEDVFARYGGEEFAVYCRAVPLETAGIVGERLRALVERSAFEHEGQRMPVTISVGVAAFPVTPANTGTELIAAADEALYEAKRCGRNRVLLRRSA